MRDAGGVSVGAGEDRSQRAAGGSVSLCGARHHGVAARTRPGVARVIGPVRWVLAAISRRRRELFPFPARWALSVAGARRCVPLARCALPGAMPAPRVLRCCAPAVLRPCLRGREGLDGAHARGWEVVVLWRCCSLAPRRKNNHGWGIAVWSPGDGVGVGRHDPSGCQLRSPGAVVRLGRPISVCDTETLR